LRWGWYRVNNLALTRRPLPMKTPLLMVWLLLPVVAGVAPLVQAQDDPASGVKSAIERDWVARIDRTRRASS
jgi:hypothetical protein